MNVLWDILIGISLVVVAMYAFFTIGAIWCIFHDAPRSSTEQRVRSEQTIGSTGQNETEYEAEQRRRKEIAEALEELKQMWVAQHAHDVATQIHQETSDTAVRLHQEAHNAVIRWHQQMQDDAVWAQESAYSGCEQWDDGAMDCGCDDYDYGRDCGCTDYCCDDTSIQDSFSLAADMHNSAVNDAAFTAQSDFSIFGAGSFGF